MKKIQRLTYCYNRQIYPRENGNGSLKAPEKEKVLDKRLFVIVNNRHRPAVHKDGHLLIFYRKKDARKWLDKFYRNGNGATINLTWRVEPLEVFITRT